MEDWVQIIIVLLVIGGSAFGAVAKKLIEAFTPKDPGKTSARPRPEPPRPTPPTGQARPVRPPPPVARPASRQRRESAPTDLPKVLETILSGEIPEAIPMPPAPKRPPVTLERPAPAPPRKPAPPRRPTEAPPRAQPLPLLPSGEERLGHVISVVEETGGADEMASEQRLGHLESSFTDGADLVEQKPTTASKTTAYLPGMGSPSRADLRHAVLLREILGPPVALRPDYEGL